MVILVRSNRYESMGRGRNKTVSDERLLIEMLFTENRLVRITDINDHVDLSDESIRQRMRNDLEPRGLVEIEGNGTNFYRMTDDGYEWLKTRVRELVD